ncbi:IclR family transcriptional regulator [Saccharopolyspora sp. HNM0983]|uniref:Glycerol operon regulatory protein n=1 Tax=Saccharopolyspora montiporae TaxID=2781240 RepID=A0A929FZ82_9PSEU|nr:IclR family transcriptional regulator [Saccharopolyspora sp. HNM0983]MBE9376611.1 IclR family transcriptional regulator [Saccharopolyspora sp. HNM0983]
MSVETAGHSGGGAEAEQARSGTGRVQSVDRAVALLNAVSAGRSAGRSVAELAAECELNRATAWRLLATLEHHGLVERDPVTHRYGIGFAINRMAGSAGTDSLVRAAHGTLEQLSHRTGETANLAVAQQLGLTYVDEVVPPVVLSARWLGEQVPFHATSAGKAFLAWLPEHELASMLAAPLPEYTRTTRTDEEALRTELHGIRTAGYAVSRGELESQVYGVAAPVLDAHRHPFAVISIWGPQDRLPEERFAELGALAQQAAAEVAANAG